MSELVLIETGLYILTGAFAGFAAGLLGIGGGLIIVPILYFSFLTQGYEQQTLMHMALATSLATIIITSISSTIAHQKKQAILWRVVFSLAPGICLGAWFGAEFASQLNTAILKPLFGIFELFVAALMLSQYQSQQHQFRLKPVTAFIGGNIIGSVSAIVGIGGGTLTVPFLHWNNIKIKNAVATSAACGFPIAVAGTTSYIVNGWNIETSALSGDNVSFGYVQLNAFITIAFTSFIFAPLGAKVAHKISDLHLKKFFSLLLFVLGVRMLVT